MAKNCTLVAASGEADGQFVGGSACRGGAELTEDAVLLAVALLAVQAQQSAVVEVLHQAFELVAERTPPLPRRDKTFFQEQL